MGIRPAERLAALSLALALLLGVAAPRLDADHIPIVPLGVAEFQARIAATLNTQYFDPFVEIQGAIEGPEHEFQYRSFTVGSYVRVHPNIKLGAFYRLQAGSRHDDDWKATGGVPAWEWEDTTTRLEHVLIADLSPRFLLPFVPAKDWVLMLKTRYFINLSNMQQSIMFRPALTYFVMVDREPLVSFTIAYGLYFPLNFGTTTVYEQARYFEALVHLSPSLMVELSTTWKTINWSPSRDLVASGEPVPDGIYPLRYNPVVFGVGLVWSYSL